MLNGERVLFECWAYKRSRWLGRWPLRWMVLTPSKLVSFHAERGYALGAEPTEVHEVSSFRGAQPVVDAELCEGSVPSAPLECLIPSTARLPGGRLASTDCDLSAVQVRLVGSGRQLLLSMVGTEGGRPNERRCMAIEFATAIVNAFCARRTGFQQYLLPGTMHAFEPRGLVAVRSSLSSLLSPSHDVPNSAR